MEKNVRKTTKPIKTNTSISTNTNTNRITPSITTVNREIVGELSKFFAGFGIDFPTEEIDYDKDYEMFRDNYSANFASGNSEINVMGMIKTLFDETKKPSVNKKHLRKLLLTKEFCKQSSGKVELPNCCICISEIQLKQKLIFIKCGHMYHDTCLIEWHKKNKNCPMCRYDLKMYK
jgi:hypothetical protein